MKILTKEEEDAHYAATVRGGTIGGLLGLGVGLGSAVILHRRWPLFRNLTLPFKSFYVTSIGTFTAIIAADRSSRSFEMTRHLDVSSYQDVTARAIQEARRNRTQWEKAKDWGRENRYPIVMASWVASMAASLGIVSKNKYLTKPQKLVQARVYAQGLTLLVLVASAAFEVSDARKGKGRYADSSEAEYDTVMVVDDTDPEGKRLIPKRVHREQYAGEDLWRDMIESEEKRLKERQEELDRMKRADRARKASAKKMKKQNEHEHGEEEEAKAKAEMKA